MTKFRVWELDGDMEDGRDIEAFDWATAAERFAERMYSEDPFERVEVIVSAGGAPRRYIVHAETDVRFRSVAATPEPRP